MLIALAVACPADAECTYPKPPDNIPDGKTASETDMMEAMKAFKVYNEEVKTYGACLEEEVNSKSESISTSQLRIMKEIQFKKQNTAIAELQAKAKEFNEQVKAFKSRG
jgi:hypothetical protein